MNERKVYDRYIGNYLIYYYNISKKNVDKVDRKESEKKFNMNFMNAFIISHDNVIDIRRNMRM